MKPTQLEQWVEQSEEEGKKNKGAESRPMGRGGEVAQMQQD